MYNSLTWYSTRSIVFLFSIVSVLSCNVLADDLDSQASYQDCQPSPIAIADESEILMRIRNAIAKHVASLRRRDGLDSHTCEDIRSMSYVDMLSRYRRGDFVFTSWAACSEFAKKNVFFAYSKHKRKQGTPNASQSASEVPDRVHVSPSDRTMRMEEYSLLSDALLKLTPEERQIIGLRVGESRAWTDISEVTGRDVKTVRNKWDQAIRKLHRELEPPFPRYCK